MDTGTEVEESIAFPADILANIGGINVIASASVIGNLEGAFEYLRDYPYIATSIPYHVAANDEVERRRLGSWPPKALPSLYGVRSNTLFNWIRS